MRILFIVIGILFAQGIAQAADEWIVKESSYSVSETVDRLAGVIEQSPAKLVARLDHQANAARVGLELHPATILIFGNPAIGTPIMQAEPRAGLDLPVKVLVWSEGGQTLVGYLDPEALKARYAISGADEAFDKMTTALDAITDKATSTD